MPGNPFTKTLPVWQVVIVAIVVVAGTWFIIMFRQQSAAIQQHENSDLGVEDLVNRLRGELEQMEEDRLSSGKPALFQVRNFDLELDFVIKSSQKQHGKIEYEVVTAEMEREFGNERTHKLTLHMELIPAQIIRSTSPTAGLSLNGAEELPALKAGRK
jgi:hypothetical protein